MQPRRQTRASSLTVAQFLGHPALPPVRKPRSNRASRALNSQFIAGASRRLKSQSLEGASRRLNSQSVAAAAVAAGVRSSRFAPEAYVKAARTAHTRPCCPAVQSCKPASAPVCAAPPALPNPSLKRSANGRPPGPGRRYAVHFHRPGPGVLPSSPA